MRLSRTSVIIILFLFFCFSGYAQNKLFVLSGYVKDKETGTALPGATVYIKSLKTGTNTSPEGYFELNIPVGKYIILYSFVGYKSDSASIEIHSAATLHVQLSAITTVMNEITVSDKKEDKQLTQTETGVITITQKEIQNLPYLLGEADPIRILQLMPGVQTSGEGNTGFYVRGGAVDQNLMLLDNSIVYNPSHLFGFFSVFNGSAIHSLDLYKGGIPADYGGRLSSVTQVNTRRGDQEQFKVDGGIGIIAANVLVEGPIKKNKGSFLIAGRRTYLDLFIDPLRELFSVEEKIDYYFYDLNINADYQVTPKDQLSFRSYFGQDNFMFGTGSSFHNTMKWGNKTSALNWVHLFKHDLYGKLSLHTTSYNMDFGASINTYRFKMASDIFDKGFTYTLDLKTKKHGLTVGVDYTRHTLRPNNIDAYSENVVLDFDSKTKLHAEEGAVFLNDKITLSDKIELNAGIRFTAYSHLGNFTRYIEDENFQVLDTVQYKRRARIKNYINAEPRLALRYSLNSVSSIKVSYDRAYQYMHMAPLSSASLPMDMWVPSSSVIKPQSANQYSAGYFRNFENHTIESSVVVYYKTMLNQLEYRNGVIIGYSKGFNYDDNFVFGKGKSYGAEFLVRKNSGVVNGSVAYTLSRTTREFPDLNSGKSFAAKYDRLHDISLFVNYKHNRKWIFSGIFVYGTGNALNLPVARYIIQGNVINEYGDRNSFRMPAYHRLDLAATYTVRKNKRFESSWIFSVYNVYNRRNPYYIYFETKGDLKALELETSLKQVSLFPVIPSVTYRFKF